MPGESNHRSGPAEKHLELGADDAHFSGPDLRRHPSADSTPSDSGSSPSDTGPQSHPAPNLRAQTDAPPSDSLGSWEVMDHVDAMFRLRWRGSRF
uniref:Uncharacterized protein n=1 Tax=Knipowitschia caucasica TaxID=637954 RepID=A0AAV2MD13_KNICA